MTEEFLPWSTKYRPKETTQIIGQPEAVDAVLNHINKFAKGTALILQGSPGTGKTSIVRAAADELDMEFIDMNASDFRTAAAIKEKIGHASAQQTLLQKKGKVIMVDEVDGLHGNSDRGGKEWLNYRFPP